MDRSSVAPLSSSGQMVASRPPYLATLVVRGPAWRSRFANGNQVPLFRPETHIGKLASNDIMITDPFASRIHAVIRWTPQGYSIEDLRSTNGTYLNGQRINGVWPLQPGQIVRIGQTELTFYPLQGQGSVAPSYSAAPAPIARTAPPAAHAPFQYVDRGLRSGQGVGGWMGLEWRKHYWKVLLLGFVLLFIGEYLLNHLVGTPALLFVIPLASALAPVTFFIYCWDSDYLSDMPRWIPWGAFVSGAALGVTLAFILEMIFVNGNSLGAAMIIGFIEESCKALAVVFFLRSRKLRSEIDGVVLGAAAGAGFATLETCLYAVTAYAQYGIAEANHTLLLRGLLAIFGHVIWTAIVVGAVWRDRGQRSFRLTFGVLLAFAIAVTLHGLWDGVPLLGMLIAGLVGMWLMRFFLREAVAREKFGAMAPPPAPLLLALLTYIFHPFRDPAPRPVAPPAGSFSGTWQIAPAIVPAMGGQWPPAPAPQPPRQPFAAPQGVPPQGVPPQGVPPQQRVCFNGHVTVDPAARFCRICGAPLAA